MAVVATLVTVAAPIADSAGVPRAAVVVADRPRSVVDVLYDGLLWWRGTVSQAVRHGRNCDR